MKVLFSESSSKSLFKKKDGTCHCYIIINFLLAPAVKKIEDCKYGKSIFITFTYLLRVLLSKIFIYQLGNSFLCCLASRKLLFIFKYWKLSCKIFYKLFRHARYDIEWKKYKNYPDVPTKFADFFFLIKS
jgi:hypothetical protein